MTGSRASVKSVVVDGQTWEKPFEWGCGACRSPYSELIDQVLAEGWSYRNVREFFSGRTPGCPNELILRHHVSAGHLIPPHLKARATFESAAAARGEDTLTHSATGEDALASIIALGRSQLLSGAVEVRPSDMVAAVRLQEQIRRARDGEGVEASTWQAAFMEFFDLIKGYLTPAQWRQFVKDAYGSPALRQVLARDDRSLPPGGDT